MSVRRGLDALFGPADPGDGLFGKEGLHDSIASGGAIVPAVVRQARAMAGWYDVPVIEDVPVVVQGQLHVDSPRSPGNLYESEERRVYQAR